MFSTTSRYQDVPNAAYIDPEGRTIAYKRLRLTPDAPSIQAHTVVQGDRLDLLAFQYYGDPEQFWRICDANAALRPDDLTASVGKVLRIPIPQR